MLLAFCAGGRVYYKSLSLTHSPIHLRNQPIRACLLEPPHSPFADGDAKKSIIMKKVDGGKKRREVAVAHTLTHIRISLPPLFCLSFLPTFLPLPPSSRYLRMVGTLFLSAWGWIPKSPHSCRYSEVSVR